MCPENEPMSKEFKLFQRDLRASGKAWADGIDAANVEKLVGDERKQAGEILEALLRKNDLRAVAPLAALRSPAALQTLLRVFGESRAPTSGHAMIALALWKLTGESQYRDSIFANMEHPDPAERIAILSMVEEAGPSKNTIERLLAVVANDPDPAVRGHACDTILNLVGLARPLQKLTEPVLNIVIAIEDAIGEDRRQALQEFTAIVNSAAANMKD